MTRPVAPRRGGLLGVVLVALVLATMAGAGTLSAQEASHRCEEYDSQEDAQAAYDRDPERFRELDDDGDGIACEHLASAGAGGSAIFPWLAGGVLVVGAAGGVMLARRRAAQPAPASPLPSSPAPDYDPAVELELELIKAERDAAGEGEEPSRHDA